MLNWISKRGSISELDRIHRFQLAFIVCRFRFIYLSFGRSYILQFSQIKGKLPSPCLRASRAIRRTTAVGVVAANPSPLSPLAPTPSSTNALNRSSLLILCPHPLFPPTCNQRTRIKPEFNRLPKLDDLPTCWKFSPKISASMTDRIFCSLAKYLDIKRPKESSL